MSFFAQIAKAIPKGLEHARAEAIGILNPNRRHDEPEEIAQDQVRAEINASHRFESFAGERWGNNVKWHIDGHDYMWALSEMLDNAKEAIFILDWWLTPELYLRRPPAHFPEWRLDKILKRKAAQGVKIHVIVYKEVTQTMSMCSKHTKAYLESLHPNITCMRHPDHIGAKDSVQFWSHHEKVVVVDNHYAAIGGLDLCFGRWDTHTHPLADVHPTDFSRTLFPGQDYNNARVMDFKDVYNYASNTLSILDTPRMPWHDVHMTLVGPVVLDIVQHFVERWNEIKKRKYRDEAQYPWLDLPHNVQAAPNEAVARHPHLERWRAVGHRYKQRWHARFDNDEDGDEDEDHPKPEPASCKVQVVRSVSDWSHGVLVEHSIQNAYIQLIREAKHFIYIENQFFISATKEGDVVKNLIAQALVERIVRAAQQGTKFKVIVCIPEVPGFAGDVKSETALKTIMAAQYRTLNRGGDSIYEEIRKAGYEPLDYIRFYHLRSYDRINAPMASFISQMQDNSHVTFHEAQVALARQWIGQDPTTSQKEVTLALPEPTTEGLVVTEKTPPKTATVQIPESSEAAAEAVRRFESGAEGLRGDEEVADTVSQHMLSDRTGLEEERWLGTPDEELNAYVSELLYIHSKVMIVDDERVIMGSANINDRSQKGDGDSEICLVVEDEQKIDSYMDGQPFRASRFAATLRRKLFREHLGLIPPQMPSDSDPQVTSFMRPAPYPNKDETELEHDMLVVDPIAEETTRLWTETARKNREIFTELFRPVPTNLVRNWGAYDNYVPKVKTGHVVPGTTLDRLKNRLSQVRGALVECPIDFLIDEKEFVTGPEWKGLNPTLPIYI
ncbi:putative phospholipase d [Lyophyllum shimeji]|uniref:Phospholipase n=1 Tax=Lyophyllum shimeji TaxID=47721 RepID=A0A9P3PWR5_LYOSH|nr:putative phospholipase d [Lyophyllum shimeji]